MKKENPHNSFRRKFLRLGSLAIGAISLRALLPIVKNQSKVEKVKMLTADGRVVLVNKKQNAKTGKLKSRNKDILSWRKVKSPKV